MRLAHHDFETYSTIDLTVTGADVYAAHPSTGAHCLAYTLADEAPTVWRAGDAAPSAFLAHIAAGGPIACWNASFEEAIWRHVIPRQCPGWPLPKPEQFHDIMTWAQAAGLPAALGNCAPAMGLQTVKDDAGNRVMKQLMKPRGATPDGAPVWWHDSKDAKTAEKFARLYAYCAQDVEVERAVAKRLRPLSPSERRVWLMDRTINRRGILLDDIAVADARKIAQAEAKRLNAEMAEATGGAVKAATNTGELVQFVRDFGLSVAGVAKGDVKELLAKPGVPAEVRRALEIRQEAGKASTAKFTKMLAGRSLDGRARDLFQYHGATTGRWAGRRIQPQNMPRPNMSAKDVADCIELFGLEHGADMLRFGYGAPLDILSWCLRGVLVPAPGKVFLGGDFANIEGRVLAWLAGETWKLDAFSLYDTPRLGAGGVKQFDKKGELIRVGPDLYKVAYGRAFDLAPEDVSKDQRQIGKVMELACIAEGQLVTTDCGLIPIEDVTTEMKVFDGVCFVPHKGVVYQGIKEVFEYDGLTATADHVVWTEGEPRPIPFGHAASRGSRLLRPEPRGADVRTRRDNKRVCSLHERLERGLRRRSLPGVWPRVLGSTSEPNERAKQRLPVLLSAKVGPDLAAKTRHGYAKPMHFAEECGLETVRGPRHPIPVSIGSGRGAVGTGEHRAASRAGYRPYRQQRALRAGEPTLRDAFREHVQPKTVQANGGRARLGENGKPARSARDAAVSCARLSPGGGYRARVQGGSRQAEELALHPPTPRRARVFDILEAGPRNRFVVSGALVHNCGYQGGVGAFRSMAKNYDANLQVMAEAVQSATPAEGWQRAEKKRLLLQIEHKQHADLPPQQYTALRVLVDAWRAAHPAVKGFWGDIEACAIEAVKSPGQMVSTKTGLIAFNCGKDFLYCRLPSGRVLSYARPSVVWVENEITKKPQQVLQYFAEGKDRKNPSRKEFQAVQSYGGLLVENATQAVARDVLVEAMFRMEAAGLPIVLHVHDEARAEVPKESADLALCERVMAKNPSWAAGLPIAVECDIMERYHK